jgi:simple sugar transport system permease protein
VGLVVIGGEGALALGGLAAAVVPQMLPAGVPWLVALPLMGIAGMLAGALWIGLVGALRQWRGVNETISSLLMSYIAIALFKHMVEGPLRDPASLNKPSTLPIPTELTIGSFPGLDVHWGLAWGIVACVLAWVFVKHSTQGFAMRVVGGNARAARLVGLPVNSLAMVACLLGGAAAGLAGMFEVSAVQGCANASLLAGYGFAGILVAFAARQNPLAIIVCALMIGGIDASGSLLQRRLELPDATTLVLQGLLFANLLAWEALGGRIAAWRVKLQALAMFEKPAVLELNHV